MEEGVSKANMPDVVLYYPCSIDKKFDDSRFMQQERQRTGNSIFSHNKLEKALYSSQHRKKNFFLAN